MYSLCSCRFCCDFFLGCLQDPGSHYLSLHLRHDLYTTQTLVIYY